MPPAGETDYIKIGAQQLEKESVQRRPPNSGRNEVPRPNSGAPHFGLSSRGYPTKVNLYPICMWGYPTKINRPSWLPHFGLKLPHIVTTYPIPASSLPHVTRAGVWYPILEKPLWVLPHSANFSVISPSTKAIVDLCPPWGAADF